MVSREKAEKIYEKIENKILELLKDYSLNGSHEKTTGYFSPFNVLMKKLSATIPGEKGKEISPLGHNKWNIGRGLINHMCLVISFLYCWGRYNIIPKNLYS